MGIINEPNCVQLCPAVAAQLHVRSRRQRRLSHRDPICRRRRRGGRHRGHRRLPRPLIGLPIHGNVSPLFSFCEKSERISRSISGVIKSQSLVLP